MFRKFILPIEPFSINAMYCRNRSFKTMKGKDWTYNALSHLSYHENERKMLDLKEAFDPKKHYFRVDLAFYFPEKKLFTKDGRLKTPDLSNIEKPLIDLFFDKQFYGKEPPFGCNNLNIDDKYIGELSSTKRVCPDEQYHINVKISIKSLDPLKSKESHQFRYAW